MSHDGDPAVPAAISQKTVWPAVRREWFLAVAVLTGILFLAFSERLFGGLGNPLVFAGLFVWLFATVLGSALGVVRHAEAISERLGEPFGTLILTLSITAIEVMSITAVMMHGANNPELVRDTLLSVVMIILGGMVGTALLVGAIRHHEQSFNLQGANAYLGVIVPLVVLSLVLPDFTSSTVGPTLTGLQQAMVGLMAVGLYTIFLFIQMGRHRAYFALPDEGGSNPHAVATAEDALLPHVLLLFSYMLPVVFLVEELARPIDYVIETLGAPPTLGGVVMAVLVATPEAIGGVQAALANRLQRSVNIFLGSVLATIGLTVPAMLVVSNFAGLDLVLGLAPNDLVMLLLILAVSVITFSSGRTHLLQGAVHVLLFLGFLVLLFEG